MTFILINKTQKVFERFGQQIGFGTILSVKRLDHDTVFLLLSFSLCFNYNHVFLISTDFVTIATILGTGILGKYLFGAITV